MLKGKLNGMAVRVPLLNASLTDCVFQVSRRTSVEEVNRLLKTAADGRSGIVDALSTMVVDGTCVKVLAWYDNEWGYANRLVELARKVGQGLR